MFLFYKINTIIYSYLKAEQRHVIADAFLFGADAHETQTRSSGEPYFTHPIAVACVLAGMRLDTETIIAALLHDVVEDTDLNSSEIASRYGNKTAELVEGVTKLTKIESNSKAEQQAESFHKMMLAMVQDIRVIIIKLADRLHNMSTLGHLRPDKRRRIATETLEVYTPIAHRLGMHHFKNSFEELAFEAMHPFRYKTLKAKVLQAQKYRDRLFRKILDRLQHHLADLVEKDDLITGRKKRLYSIYQKMRDRDMSFSEIMDIYAFKVVVENRRDCYLILGAVHEIFRPMSSRFKDYIATPKANGYQSLHTTVFGPYGIPIEIQIKTKVMDDTAEKGVAAHWIYKSPSLSHKKAQKWLVRLAELQQHVTKPSDFVEGVKLDLFPEEVYVFSPHGKIIELPKGATCVDFAYHIHTDIGNHCVAAKINRRLTPLSYKLHHGDTVEIITAPSAHPNPTWLSFIQTARAKHALKHALKRHGDSELIKLGKQLLEQSLYKKSIQYKTISEELIQAGLKKFKCLTLDELYVLIGQGQLIAGDFSHYIAEETQGKSPYISDKIQVTGRHIHQLSTCCTPIPGDPISALILESGIIFHHSKCKVFKESARINTIVGAEWAHKIGQRFLANLTLSLQNTQGAIAKVTSNISYHDTHITNFTVIESDQQYGIVQIIVEVKNLSHLQNVIRDLKRLKTCLNIERTLP